MKYILASSALGIELFVTRDSVSVRDSDMEVGHRAGGRSDAWEGV